MRFTYLEIMNDDVKCHDLIGITVEQFVLIMVKTKPYHDIIISNKKCPGRGSAFRELGNILLVTLMYIRNYDTMRVLSVLLDIDKTQVCRWCAVGLGLLEQSCSVPKNLEVTSTDLGELGGCNAVAVDATEQEIERPLCSDLGQEAYYSGKQKMHTIKTELIVNAVTDEVVTVSESVPGAMHDKKLRDESAQIADDVIVLADSGYQGIQEDCEQAIIPTKKPKGGSLTNEQKILNKAISQARVCVEHVIGEAKTFKVLCHRFRNFRYSYSTIFGIVMYLVNLRACLS